MPRRTEARDLFGKSGGGVEQLAEDIELTLPPCSVPHSYGTAPPPSAQVRQFTFRQVALASKAEHDLKVSAVHLRRRRRRQVVEELVGLVGARGHPQCNEGERRVAHPRVSVVPVAVATDGLRE